MHNKQKITAIEMKFQELMIDCYKIIYTPCYKSYFIASIIVVTWLIKLNNYIVSDPLLLGLNHILVIVINCKNL